jgi:UDP-N-acetylmuramoyl-tripeptide--D-alanyl-D-alanine ligase
LEHNIFLIDNGYNANPASSEQSLAILKALNGTQKVVITPGFIDLGSEQPKENERLGEQIAKVADVVGVIESVNEAAIFAGLTKQKVPKKNIVVASTEQEAMTLLTPLIQPGAVILFENSVPELYK